MLVILVPSVLCFFQHFLFVFLLDCLAHVGKEGKIGEEWKGRFVDTVGDFSFLCVFRSEVLLILDTHFPSFRALSFISCSFRYSLVWFVFPFFLLTYSFSPLVAVLLVALHTWHATYTLHTYSAFSGSASYVMFTLVKY